MAEEDHEMPNGWPLGLETMNMKLRVGQSLAAEPSYAPHVPSFSCTSFSSSGLDTESTASFFQDNSVSLGRLMGMRPGNRSRQRLRSVNSLRFEEHEIRAPAANSQPYVSKEHGVCGSSRICIPLLPFGASGKMSQKHKQIKLKRE